MLCYKMQHPGCDVEVNQKRKCIDNCCNKWAGHNCRVEADLGCQHGQAAADELGDEHYKEQCQADYYSHKE